MGGTMDLRMDEAMDRVARGWLAGAAGTAAMTVAQTRLLPKLPSGKSRLEPRYPRTQGEPATETVARRLVEGLAARRLTARQKKVAGDLIHFATGAACAGLLSLTLRRRPTLGDGLAFGALVWLVNDNLLVPVFRFGDWPWRYPPGVSLKGLAAHLIYGAGSVLALRAFPPAKGRWRR